MQLSNPLVLASSSPRRQYLMKEAGFSFRTEKPDVEEEFPSSLPVSEVAKYLAKLKADWFRPRLDDQIVLTADTVVLLDGQILNKPSDRDDAIRMLSALAGNTHRVMTGVCILTRENEIIFDDTTAVSFRPLSQKEIEYYIDNFQPFDKAGSYGAQDCLQKGMNPFSPGEVEFLNRIGNTRIIDQTISSNESEDPHIAIIEHLVGSYFNVMGLPIHLVYERLGALKVK